VIRAYSAEQIRAAEAPHLARDEPLMARAAAGLAAVIRELQPSSILVLAGAGNNGGDALFAAALLASEGIDVELIETGSRRHEAGLAAALTSGAKVVDSAQAGAQVWKTDVLVDGMLGIGSTAGVALRGRAREVTLDLLEAFKFGAPARVVAVDIPSGVDPDDGSVPDLVVLTADITVTFGGYKAGLFREPARSYAGEVRLVDVGISEDLAAMTPILQI
jgi:NAD(P)H-hydrate epimerase